MNKFGKRWGDILQKYKKHFNKQRNRYDLSTKYNFLASKPEEFKYFQEQAALLEKTLQKSTSKD